MGVFNLIVVGNLQTVIIMAKVKMVFYDTEREEVTLQCFATSKTNICLSIEKESWYKESSFQKIYIDRSTAIRLVRELKKQIGYLESEVDNG